jgi:hypothetical protein
MNPFNIITMNQNQIMLWSDYKTKLEEIYDILITSESRKVYSLSLPMFDSFIRKSLELLDVVKVSFSSFLFDIGFSSIPAHVRSFSEGF